MTRYTRWTLSRALALATAALLTGCDGDQPFAPESRSAVGGGQGPAPAPPSNANAVAASYNRVDVSWRDNSSNETGFEVHRSTTGPGGSFALEASLGANITSYANTGLTGSSQYCYEVRAFRITGNKKNYSAFSNAACATTPAAPVPAAPSGVHAAPLLGYAFDVTWTDNSSDESGFRVERGASSAGPWTSVVTTNANVTAFADWVYPSDERPFCYRILAVNSFGSSDPSNVACTASPAVPTNLAGTPVGGTAVDLTWTDNSAVEDGFEVLRTGGGADWSVAATLPANATAYRDAGLIPDNTYGYEVRTTKDGGSSATSAPVQVVLATTPPAAPSDLDVVPQSSSGVYGFWIDQSSNEAGFRVERSTGASWVTAVTTGVGESYFGDGGLSAEQQVCYRVIAFNALGDSPPSNSDCTAPPAAPSDLTATGIDISTVDLSWIDNSAVEDGYEVWVDDGYGNHYVIASLGPNTTSYRDESSPYWYFYILYVVVAVKDGGYSDISNYAYPTSPGGASGVRARSPKPTPAPWRPPRVRGKP